MLINFVGGDRSGKTTQIEMLKHWIKEEFGISSRLVAKSNLFDPTLFPANGVFNCSYKDLIEGVVPQMKGESRALLLFYLLAASICYLPPGSDELVICDGYWHKNFATEAALGVSEKWLRQVVSFLPAPDLTVFLAIDPTHIVARGISCHPYECGCPKECSPDAFIQYQSKVIDHLRRMAISERWPIVDANRSRSDVFNEIQALLRPSIAQFADTWR